MEIAIIPSVTRLDFVHRELIGSMEVGHCLQNGGRFECQLPVSQPMEPRHYKTTTIFYKNMIFSILI